MKNIQQHKKIVLTTLFFFVFGLALIVIRQEQKSGDLTTTKAASVILAQTNTQNKDVLINDYITTIENYGKLEAMKENTEKEYERNQAILMMDQMNKKMQELERALSTTLSAEEYTTLTEKTKLEKYSSSYAAIDSTWDKNSSTVDMSKIDMSVLNDKITTSEIINRALGISENVFAEAKVAAGTEFGKKTYVPLSVIPGLTDASNSTVTMKPFLRLLFKWGIAIAVILSVVMITFGGFQYMTTDAVFAKSEGRAKINAAIIGLLLALSAWLILQTVDPRILREPQSSILN